VKSPNRPAAPTIGANSMNAVQFRSLPAILLCSALLAGCNSLGPKTVPADRFNYSDAISDSWKQQTLLNIVKMRYLDPPVFVDVGQIVAGYSLQTSLNAGAQISSAGAVQGTNGVVGGSEVFVDRPTITYVPLTGSAFIRALMTPLPPASVFSTIQSGWPADSVLFASLISINGLKNQTSTVDGLVPPDPGFFRVIALIRAIQESDDLVIRGRQTADHQQITVLTFISKDASEQTLQDIAELRKLLRLNPDATEFTLVAGSGSTSDTEIAVQTRSILHLMATMATEADVPPEDVAQGRAVPGWESVDAAKMGRRLIQIKCTSDKPDNAFAAVKYRDHWFWIDDGDLKSKRSFSFIMLLFTLSDTGERDNPPQITIPAQ
jgi:hypothetical protein